MDTAVSGASFTSVGEVFAGEQDIVTSGYGALDGAGRPVGGGTLQVYRPGANLADWTKVTVFGPEAGIIFPNATTIADVDGDGDSDIIVPSGYFFGTDPASPPTPHAQRRHHLVGEPGRRRRSRSHDVITGQAGSYHGVQFVDLDGDGIKDIVSVGEEAQGRRPPVRRRPSQTQFFKGNGRRHVRGPGRRSPNVGGSQPVVDDVDGDGDLDIISSQYFHPSAGDGAAPARPSCGSRTATPTAP